MYSWLKYRRAAGVCQAPGLTRCQNGVDVRARRPVNRAPAGQGTHAGVGVDAIDPGLELAIACRVATRVNFLEMARQAGLELRGSLEILDLPHPAGQWVPSGTNLGHLPGCADRVSSEDNPETLMAADRV